MNYSKIKKILFLILFIGFSNLAFSEEGLLEACEAGILVSTPITSEVVTNPGDPVFNGGQLISALGLETPCASQNWFGPNGDDYSAPRALSATAFPNVISISSLPVNVTFNVIGVGLSGGLDLYMPECMPPATAAATFCENADNTVVFRLADPSGNFTGKWTIATATNNPYFQMARNGSCPSPLSNLTNPGNGAPCTYELRFNIDNNGIPVLTKAMQLVVFNGAGGGGTTTIDGGVYYNATAESATPLLFIPGSSTALSISAGKGILEYGESTLIAGKVIGAVVPSDLPVLALEAAAQGTNNWAQVASATTDTAGEVGFPISPVTNTDYRLRLLGDSLGADVVSETNQVMVKSKIVLKKKRTLVIKIVNGQERKKYFGTFSGSVNPLPLTGSKIHLERLVTGNWIRVKSSDVTNTGTYRVKQKLTKGKNLWRIAVDSSILNANSTSEEKELKG